MQPWWTGLTEAPPDDATALHALGLGFMAARTLNVALEFDLFTRLSAATQPQGQIAQALGQKSGQPCASSMPAWL